MKRIVCLFIFQSYFLTDGYSQKLTRESFFDYVLSDTSGEDKRELLIKFNLLDQYKKKRTCMTYNDRLYVSLKNAYGYDFCSYKALMKRILRGDTLVSYSYFGEYLANDIVVSKNVELDSVWERGEYAFLDRYTCDNQLLYGEPWQYLYYLFDQDITNNFSGGGYGHLVYFNPVVKRKIQENRKSDLKKIIHNEDGTLRGTCRETSIRRKKEKAPIYRHERCDPPDSDVKCFIVDFNNDSSNLASISQGFTLKTSDTLYKITNFHLIAVDKRDYWVEFDCAGNGENCQEIVRTLPDGITLYIENIRATKDGKCYLLPSLTWKLKR